MEYSLCPIEQKRTINGVIKHIPANSFHLSTHHDPVASTSVCLFVDRKCRDLHRPPHVGIQRKACKLDFELHPWPRTKLSEQFNRWDLHDHHEGDDLLHLQFGWRHQRQGIPKRSGQNGHRFRKFFQRPARQLHHEKLHRKLEKRIGNSDHFPTASSNWFPFILRTFEKVNFQGTYKLVNVTFGNIYWPFEVKGYINYRAVGKVQGSKKTHFFGNMRYYGGYLPG